MEVAVVHWQHEQCPRDLEAPRLVLVPLFDFVVDSVQAFRSLQLNGIGGRGCVGCLENDIRLRSGWAGCPDNGGRQV